jgi:hypothetical protein
VSAEGTQPAMSEIGEVIWVPFEDTIREALDLLEVSE